MPNNPQTPPGPQGPHGGAPQGFGPPPPQQAGAGQQPVPPPQQGYGYPPQAPPAYQQPPGGYYPGPQGAGPLPPQRNEPDWNALADEHEAAAKRKRRMVIGSSVLGLLVLGAAAAFGITAMAGKKTPSAHGSSTPTAVASTKPSSPASASGGASASPSAHPSHAPITASDFFSAKTLTIRGHTYTRVATSSTTPCWQVASGGLGNVLSSNGCTQLLRATYVSSNGIAATVGVAVYDNSAGAHNTDAQYKGKMLALHGTGAETFCQNVSCAVTHAAHGRFAYFSIAGPVSGSAGDQNADAQAAGHGVAGYALSVIMTKYGSSSG